MNKRVDRIIELAKSCNTADIKTNSTDLENTVKMEYTMEIRDLYKDVEKKQIREDIIFLMEFLQKIERSHGSSSRGKNLIIETIGNLEKL